MASPVRSPTQDFHVFAGLEGLASSLITREPSQKKIKSENAAAAALAAASPKNRGGGGELWEHDEPRHSQLSSFLQAEEYVAASTSTPSRKKHARSASRRQQQSPPSKEAVVSLAEVVTKNAGTGGVAPLGKLTMLRQMTIDAPVFSVMQDLATPHRSYIYGEKEEKSASRRGIRADDAQRAEARRDLIRSIDSKHRGHKERMLRIKGPYAGIPRRASPSFRVMDVPSRHSSDRVLDHGIMSLLRMSEDDVPNELSGPFRDTDTTRSKPAVMQISTFEDYLERAVNSVRTSPVRFENLGARCCSAAIQPCPVPLPPFNHEAFFFCTTYLTFATNTGPAAPSSWTGVSFGPCGRGRVHIAGSSPCWMRRLCTLSSGQRGQQHPWGLPPAERL
jgi:hypothetical protein